MFVTGYWTGGVHALLKQFWSAELMSTVVFVTGYWTGGVHETVSKW